MANKIYIAVQYIIAILGLYNIVGGVFVDNHWQMMTGLWMIIAMSHSIPNSIKEGSNDA